MRLHLQQQPLAQFLQCLLHPELALQLLEARHRCFFLLLELLRVQFQDDRQKPVHDSQHWDTKY